MIHLISVSGYVLCSCIHLIYRELCITQYHFFLTVITYKSSEINLKIAVEHVSPDAGL